MAQSGLFRIWALFSHLGLPNPSYPRVIDPVFHIFLWGRLCGMKPIAMSNASHREQGCCRSISAQGPTTVGGHIYDICTAIAETFNACIGFPRFGYQILTPWQKAVSVFIAQQALPKVKASLIIKLLFFFFSFILYPTFMWGPCTMT